MVGTAETRGRSAGRIVWVAALLAWVAVLGNSCGVEAEDEVEARIEPTHETVASGSTPDIPVSGILMPSEGCGSLFGLKRCSVQQKAEFAGVESVESTPEELVHRVGTFPGDESRWFPQTGEEIGGSRAVVLLADELGTGEVEVAVKFQKYRNGSIDRTVTRRKSQSIEVVEPNRIERFGGIEPCGHVSPQERVIPFPTHELLSFRVHVMQHNRPVYVDDNWLKTTERPPIVVEEGSGVEPASRDEPLRREPNVEAPNSYLGRKGADDDPTRVSYRLRAADGPTPRRVEMTSAFQEGFERTLVV